MVVRGGEGLDELSTTSETHIWDVRDGEVVEWDLDASTVGLPRASLADLRGGSPSDNATILRDVLASKPGPVRDIVVLNAAAALVVAGVADTIEDGIARAGATIDDGRANAALERLIRLSQAKADPPTV